MAPPALDDDVLRHILSYLRGRHALNVALSSKHLYGLAAPRIPAVAKCEKPTALTKLHHYMLSGSPPHARDLEDLRISFTAFDYPDDPEQMDTGYSDYWDFSQASLIGDILAHAPRVRRLVLDRLHPCLLEDSRIGDALVAMDRLVVADFGTFADGTWAYVPKLCAALRILRLSYFWAEDDDLEGERKTIPPLVEAIAPLQYLHTLELWNFDPPRMPSDESLLPWLPSIRNLLLRSASPSALELLERCPNVVNLEISFNRCEPELQPLVDGPRWQALRSLTLGNVSEIGFILHRVGAVDRIRIPDSACLPDPACLVVGRGGEEEEAEVAGLLQLIAQTSPISLSLSVGVYSAAPMTFWVRMPALAPRLRMLKLRVSLAALSAENKCWLDNVPEALRALPLVYLSVVVPEAKTAPPSPTIPANAMVVDGVPPPGGDPELEEIEKHRRLSVAALPGRLVAAIPSLRFLSVAMEEANKANLSDSETPEAQDPEDEERSSLQGKVNTTTRYWSIVDGVDVGSTQGWQELSAAEGERIRALAED